MDRAGLGHGSLHTHTHPSTNINSYRHTVMHSFNNNYHVYSVYVLGPEEIKMMT